MSDPETMRAVEVTAFGGPEVLAVTTLPVPAPGAGEVLVALDAVGVNYSDIVTRKGWRGGTPPFVAGQEGAGRVVRVGDGVDGLADGDLVSFTGARTGSYAQYACVPVARAWQVPDGVSAEVAATLQIMGITVHYLTHDVYPLAAGERCLIHAGAGGVGHILIQLAKDRGAEVFTTVGSAEKAKIAKGYGADHVIEYAREDFAERVAELTDGAGVHVVFDAVGEATLEGSVACVGFQGTLVLFGDASGLTPPLDTRLITRKAIYVTRVGMPSFIPDATSVARRCDHMLALVQAGRIRLNIQPPRPLAEAAAMHRDLEGRKTVGKHILLP